MILQALNEYFARKQEIGALPAVWLHPEAD